MKRTAAILNAIDKWASRRSCMSLYTVVFCVLSPLVFSAFIATKRTFVWQPDGFRQHVKAIYFYSKYLRSLLFDHILQGNFDIPTYTFTLGQGADILATLHYYVIGDPLLLLSIFVPPRHIAELYDGLILLRFYLAGAAFLLYLRHMNRLGSFGAGGFGTSGMLAGALVYAFCGFALDAGIRHPYFLNPMIYLPLILIGVEKVLDGERPTVLVASVFAASVSNFYFFYILGILTALYAVLRVLSRRPKNFRTTLLPLFKIAACAALGALLSSAVLFPVLRQMFDSSRIGNSPIWSLLYTPSQCGNTIAHFILAEEIHNWTVLGYAVVALFAVVHLWLKKGSRDLKTAFVVLSAMLMLPVWGAFMNGFSYVANRWEFGFSFLVAYLVVVEWENLFAVERRKTLCVVLALYVLFAFLTALRLKEYLVFLSLLLAASVAVAFAGRPRLSPSRCRILLLALVAVNLTGNACFLYAFKNPPYARPCLKYEVFQKRFFKTEADAIRDVEKTEKTGFFRYAGNGMTHNDGIRSGLHGIDCYWSLENGNIAEFRKDMRFSDSAVSNNFRTFDSCTIPTSLANVKYVVQSGDVRPFDYSAVSRRLPDKNLVLLVNDNFIPFGYTYSRGLSAESYKALSPIEKQEALLQACIVDDPADATPFAPAFSSKTVPFDLRLDDGVVFENGFLTVKNTKAKCTLVFEGIGNSETYLHIRGLHYLGRRYLTDGSLLSTEKAVFENDKKQFYRNLFYGKNELRIRMSSTNEAGDSSSASSDYKSPTYSWYSGRHDFTVNFGYEADRRTSINIWFPAPGTYSVDELSVVCLPFDRYDERVSALTEDVLRDVDFHEDKAFATDRVSGAISLSSPKYLLMTIPYSTGWSALVDGKEQEVLRANVMYSALFLPAGEHKIEMRYRTPWLREGLCVSIAAALAWMVVEIFMRRRGRKDR